jgi:hypothetical protein
MIAHITAIAGFSVANAPVITDIEKHINVIVLFLECGHNCIAVMGIGECLRIL